MENRSVFVIRNNVIWAVPRHQVKHFEEFFLTHQQALEVLKNSKEITEIYDISKEVKWYNKIWDRLIKRNYESAYRHWHPEIKSLDKHARKLCKRRSTDKDWPDIGIWFNPDEYLVRRAWMERIGKGEDR